MANSLILALVAISISVVSIGLLVAVNLSLQSDLRTMNNNLLIQSEHIESLNSELKASQEVIENQKTTLDQMQLELNRINAQLVEGNDDIKSLTHLVDNMQANMTLMQDRFESLNDRVTLLEQRLKSQTCLEQCPPPQPQDKTKFQLSTMVHGKVVWYGPSFQDSLQTNINNALVRLQSMGADTEVRSRPVDNLGDAKLVVLTAQFGQQFSEAEIKEITSYVNKGGRLILATDTDYRHCDPDSLCAMNIARNFEFGFDGAVEYGALMPAEGQSGHPIWKKPNDLSSFTDWCCDAYVHDILDSKNVKILARVSGSSIEPGEPTINVNNVPAIVLNEDPAFRGGKVLGLGYNMFVGWHGNFELFDNIMSFMLQD